MVTPEQTMRIFRHYAEIPSAAKGGVVALGNFDGVHLGHQRVIGAALAAARQRGVACGVMTFEPHPREFLDAGPPPFRLTPFRIKARLIEALGADLLLMQHFDKSFASLRAEAFIEKVLIAGLGAVHVVVGYDYRFGNGREGTVAMLQDAAARSGFGMSCLDPVAAEDGAIYSSNAIRQALLAGKPREAARLLGRAWEIEGRVEHGDQRGRTIGFPTANIGLADYLRPALGAYAIRAGVDKGHATQWLSGVANIGCRPTLNKESVLLEVHLFDFAGDLYGRHLRVALVEHLRPEMKFDGLAALRAQIAEDCKAARQILTRDEGQ
jgi:riboflavin kinase/FMN adenylyltransferase